MSMRGKLILLAAIALGGCSAGIQPPEMPEYPIYTNDYPVTVRVEWIDKEALKTMMLKNYRLTPHYEEVKKKAELQAKEGYLGLTKVPSPDDEECVIYVVKPSTANDKPAIFTLGHEFLHCLAGFYH